MGESREPSRGFLLGWKRACLSQAVGLSFSGFRGHAQGVWGQGTGHRAPGTGHRAGQLRTTGGSSHPSAAGTGPEERLRGAGAGVARQEPQCRKVGAGTATVPVPTAACPGGMLEGKVEIALCHFMWKLETLGCGGDRGGMTI